MEQANTVGRPHRAGGQWLAMQRRRRKLNQEQLAQLIGVHQTTISGYEAGKSRPSDTVASALASVFRMHERTVRRELGLYVPGPTGTQEETWPDGVLRLPAGVTLTAKQRRALDAMLDAFLDDQERVTSA